MFNKKKHQLKFKSSEELLQHVEKEVREEMNSQAITVGFWGSISVDPNKIHVSKEQADRSMRLLKDFLAEQDEKISGERRPGF